MLYAQPFYQVGKVPASISKFYGSTPMRAVPDISMPGDPNTGFEVGETQVFPHGTFWDQYRIGGTSLSSPLLAGVVAVANQRAHHKLGFINPLYYHLLGTRALHDIVAPHSPVAQVRTDFANFLNAAQGKLFRLQTVDVQSSTLHDTRGYDDETGVGNASRPRVLRGRRAQAPPLDAHDGPGRSESRPPRPTLEKRRSYAVLATTWASSPAVHGDGVPWPTASTLRHHPGTVVFTRTTIVQCAPAARRAIGTGAAPPVEWRRHVPPATLNAWPWPPRMSISSSGWDVPVPLCSTSVFVG